MRVSAMYGFLALLASSLLLPGPVAAETIELTPNSRASWGIRNVFAVFRPGHFYGNREIQVETTPPGAVLDLFYVRSNFQKGYEQTLSPVRILLPTRIEAGPRDAVTIRAFLEGFKQQETTIRVSSKQSKVVLDLAPLPNTLRAMAHTYFAGRGALSLMTDESLQIRVQKKEGGFNVVLAETAKSQGVAESAAAIRSPLIETIEALQLGEDLLIQVSLTELGSRGLQLRSKQGRDPVRDLYSYSVEMVAGDTTDEVRRALAALAAIQTGHVTGCALRYDRTLRKALGPEDLARALSAKGAFTDRYLRAAMKRLGEVSPGGTIVMQDGTRYNGAVPFELSAALSQAHEAEGYLALLRRFVAEIEPADYRQATLRSLIAPELPPAKFAALAERAESAERSCVASR